MKNNLTEEYPKDIIYQYQPLFNAIYDSGGTPLESEMQDIIRIVHRDFPQHKDESSACAKNAQVQPLKQTEEKSADDIMWKHISKEPIDIKREGLIDAPIWKAHLAAMEEYALLNSNNSILLLEKWVQEMSWFRKDVVIHTEDLLKKIEELKIK